jgi:hypothetical protein
MPPRFRPWRDLGVCDENGCGQNHAAGFEQQAFDANALVVLDVGYRADCGRRVGAVIRKVIGLKEQQ